MFLNNPASTRSVLSNNENAMASVHRPKSLAGGDGVAKKASFDENSVKTPHRSKDAAAKGGNNGQTTQRRRRALGDISNRKGAGGGAGGGGKGGVVLLKQQQPQANANQSLKPGKNRPSQVKFSKTPSSKSASGSGKARLGGLGVGLGSAAKGTASKPKAKRSSEEEYDGVYGITTRWADDVNYGDDTRSAVDAGFREEMELSEQIRERTLARLKKEDDDRVRSELERDDALFEESIRSVRERIDADARDLGTVRDVLGEDGAGGGWDDILDQKLPWEEEDGPFDPAEERRLSGTDPYSLWGDILDV